MQKVFSSSDKQGDSKSVVDVMSGGPLCHDAEGAVARSLPLDLAWLPPSIPHRRTRRSLNAAAEYVRSTAKHVTWTILGLGLCRRSQGGPKGVANEVLSYGEVALARRAI